METGNQNAGASGENTGEQNQTAAAEEVRYPIVNSTDEPDGSVKTTTQRERGTPISWEKRYPDGKRVTCDAEGGLEVTHNTDGSIEFVFPQSKVKAKIKRGSGDDVLTSRRALNGKSDEAMFYKAMYSQLTRFNGEYWIPEDLGRKLPMGDFLTLEQMFAEVNFS